MKGDRVVARNRPKVIVGKYERHDWLAYCDGGHRTRAPLMDLLVGTTMLTFCRPDWLRFKRAIEKADPR